MTLRIALAILYLEIGLTFRQLDDQGLNGFVDARRQLFAQLAEGLGGCRQRRKLVSRRSRRSRIICSVVMASPLQNLGIACGTLVGRLCETAASAAAFRLPLQPPSPQ